MAPRRWFDSRRNNGRGGLLLLAVLTLLLIMVITARAHSWFPLECCSGNDCKPLDGERVRESGNEFIVRVPSNWLGQSPVLPILTIRVPHSEVRWIAPDGGFSACPIVHLNGVPKFRCFFAPPRGVFRLNDC